MRIQITLTPPETKRIIARGIKSHPLVQRVRQRGKIVLKGGTTLSAVAEELAGNPMKISGMITPRGTLTSKFKHEINLPHSLLLEGDLIAALDSREAWEKATADLSPQDLVITGANAFDAHGHAVIMAGSYGGGNALPSFHNLFLDGIPFLVAAGLEKFVPGNLAGVAPLAGRKKMDFSYGMAVGLMLVLGEIFTEVEALETLAGVKAHVIGKGGIHGAEGSTTLIIEGAKKEVLKIDRLYQRIKGSGLSGEARNLIPCTRGSLSCGMHVGCVYKKGLRK